MAIEEVGQIHVSQWHNICSQPRKEFSIEIPDKEADAIHSSKHSPGCCMAVADRQPQSTKQLNTSYPNLTVSVP